MAREERTVNESINRAGNISTNAPRPLARTPQVAPSHFNKAKEYEKALRYLERHKFFWFLKQTPGTNFHYCKEQIVFTE